MSPTKIALFALASLLLAGDVFAEAARPPMHTAPVDLLRQGALIVSRGAALSQSVRTMLQTARKPPADIVKAACLDGKLAQINAVQRIAQQRLASLSKAVDSGLRTHEFTVLTVLGQKFQVLGQEANQCNGQSMYETGVAKVVMVIDGENITFENTPSKPPAIRPTRLPTVPPSASGMK